MSNSQMNIKTQFKTVDTVGTSLEKSSTNGGDWRFTLLKKLDLFVTYTQTRDNIFDRINNVVTSDSRGSTLGTQLGFNIGKWRFTPKYDQSIQQTDGFCRAAYRGPDHAHAGASGLRGSFPAGRPKASVRGPGCFFEPRPHHRHDLASTATFQPQCAQHQYGHL